MQLPSDDGNIWMEFYFLYGWPSRNGTNFGMNWGPTFAFDTSIEEKNLSGSFRSWLHACVALGLAIIITLDFYAILLASDNVFIDGKLH